MSLPSFADPSDLSAGSAADTPTALNVLWRVSTAVRGATGQSWVGENGELVEMSALAADYLKSVTVSASERVLRNPEGATTRAENAGPFGQSVTVEADNIYFTKAERDMLAQAVAEQYPDDAGFTGLGTISTTRGPLETASICDDIDQIDVEAGDPELIGWT